MRCRYFGLCALLGLLLASPASAERVVLVGSFADSQLGTIQNAATASAADLRAHGDIPAADHLVATSESCLVSERCLYRLAGAWDADSVIVLRAAGVAVHRSKLARWSMETSTLEAIEPPRAAPGMDLMQESPAAEERPSWAGIMLLSAGIASVSSVAIGALRYELGFEGDGGALVIGGLVAGVSTVVAALIAAPAGESREDAVRLGSGPGLGLGVHGSF